MQIRAVFTFADYQWRVHHHDASREAADSATSNALRMPTPSLNATSKNLGGKKLPMNSAALEVFVESVRWECCLEVFDVNVGKVNRKDSLRWLVEKIL